MRILFIGCVESSYRLLKKLIDNGIEIAGVITKERSQFNSDFYELAPMCMTHHVPFCYVKNINDDNSIEFIKICNPDIGFCFGWSQLIQDKIIHLFPHGIVGFHPAALPNNRGRHPLIWALALGLSETASTFFMINAGADKGDIISQRKISISYEDNARSLYDKVMDAAVEQEIELVNALENDAITYISQSCDEGNSWRKRGANDGNIDWRMSSKCIYNLVRSLTKPYVGAHFLYNNNEYKVWKVQEISTYGFENFEPGKVLSVNEDGTIDIKTGENGVRLLEFDAITVKKGEYIL